MASVGLISKFFKHLNRRQKPTRIPYSCQAQLGRSGRREPPMGGGRTARGIGPWMSQFSTLTMFHTTRRTPSGSGSGGRSTIAEYGTRSLGFIVTVLPPTLLRSRDAFDRAWLRRSALQTILQPVARAFVSF